MAYEYTKLSEVEILESPSSPNILVEDNGEIVRVPSSNLTTSAAQVQADWNETDSDSPAFILNKPDLSSSGGSDSGVETIKYYYAGQSDIITVYADADHTTILDSGNLYNNFISGKRVILIGESSTSDVLSVRYYQTTFSYHVYATMYQPHKSRILDLDLGSTDIPLGQISTGEVDTNTVIYTGDSSGSCSFNGHSQINLSDLVENINNNSRILINYSDTNTTCSVIATYTLSSGTSASMVLLEPGTTNLKTVTTE